ncbi:hypothetical protein LAJ57_13580, partial [Streptococcus pneumoniae]|uniref:hypothetical protein n=1 Tax=Streptococcus pneumoniae TaxID=1313 RepID=UPI001CC0F118
MPEKAVKTIELRRSGDTPQKAANKLTNDCILFVTAKIPVIREIRPQFSADDKLPKWVAAHD